MNRFRISSSRSQQVPFAVMAAIATLAAAGLGSLPANAAEALFFGNGYSASDDRQAAAAAAAKAAKTALGDHEAKLVLVFDGPGKDLDQRKRLLQGVASVFDLSIVYGCASYAPLTQDSNTGTVAVMAFGGDLEVTPTIADLNDGHEACGKKIGDALKAVDVPASAGRLLLLFGKCVVPSTRTSPIGRRPRGTSIWSTMRRVVR